MKSVVATYLHLDAPGEGSSFPAAGPDSSRPETQAIYWRCVVVFFASSLRHNPDSRHVLFTNAERCPVVDGIDVHSWLRRHGVDIVVVPLTFRVPKGYWGSWGCVYYLFDVVGWVSEQGDPDEGYLLIDCDAVWVRAANALFRDLRAQHAMSYTYGYDEQWTINGLSRTEMKQLFEEMDGDTLSLAPDYSCGEFLAVDSQGARRLMSLARDTFEVSLTRFTKGLPHFNEEGHMLSYLFQRLGFAQGTANPYIKRVWTGSAYNNVEPSDQELTIWHLPSEKRSGLIWLFQAAVIPTSRFWHVKLGDSYRRYVGRKVGVPKRTRLDSKRVALERRTLVWRRRMGAIRRP